MTTHQFSTSRYFTKPITKERRIIRQKVRELSNQGLTYTKIYNHLKKNGYKVSKDRTSIDGLIKNMKDRDEFYHLPIKDGIGNFRVEMLKKSSTESNG